MSSNDLIQWTIRTSMLLYVVFLITSITQLGSKKQSTWRRRIWTLSCGLFVAHVIAAFHFFHHWSHQHAFADTARQTKELLGWSFGAGIYFSYLFLIVWIVDVTWWWTNVDSYDTRSRKLSWIVHAYIFFIAFNGTIVFESGPARPFGIAACVVLIAAAVLTSFTSLGRRAANEQTAS